MAMPPVENELVYFTIVGNYRAMLADSLVDTDFDPDLGELTATVTFTPLINTGDALLVTTSNPPVHIVCAPVVGIIDTDGRLKLRRDFTDVPDGPWTPIKLLGNCPQLELDPDFPLAYRVSFTNVRIGGKPGVLNSYDFVAPDHEVELDLVEVMRQPGLPATGITKLAPTQVRVNENGDLVFSFMGEDIPDPVDLGNIAGAEGPAGPPGEPGPAGEPGADGLAATIAVGTTTTGAAGTPASVTNKGTNAAAVFDFTIPRGDAGPQGQQGVPGLGIRYMGEISDLSELPVGATHGDLWVLGNRDNPDVPARAYIWNSTTSVWDDGGNIQGARGDVGPAGPAGAKGDTGAAGGVGPAGPAGTAATIAVGTTTTGAAGSQATVTNKGTNAAAVFDFTIPTGAAGPAGAKGDPGATGPAGTAATIAVGTTTTGTAGTNATVTNKGTANAAVFDFTIPAGPAGAKGDTGAAGAKGDTGAAGPAGTAATIAVGTTTTGAAGSPATVTNKGTAGAAVFDFSIPAGPAGVAGAKGDTGAAGAAGPPGPSAVSKDANNSAKLGTDSLIYVPTSAAANAVTGYINSPAAATAGMGLWVGPQSSFDTLTTRDAKIVYIVIPAPALADPSTTKDVQ
jgi:hypothetical protein